MRSFVNLLDYQWKTTRPIESLLAMGFKITCDGEWLKRTSTIATDIVCNMYVDVESKETRFEVKNYSGDTYPLFYRRDANDPFYFYLHKRVALLLKSIGSKPIYNNTSSIQN